MSKSGCHNKVKWILSQCKWNSDWVSVFTFNLINDLNLLYYSNTTPCPNEKYNLNWINSWSDACEMANWYAGNSCQNLYHLITKYPWFNNAYNQKIHEVRVNDDYLKKVCELEDMTEKMKCGENCKHSYYANTYGCYDMKCEFTNCDCLHYKDRGEMKE